MPQRSEFLDFVIGQMAGLGVITARAMFGGHGLYCNGLFIAIIADEQLYFKADAQSQPRFEAAGLQRFQYQARGKTVQLMYYEAPTEVYDDTRAMSDWGQLALAAAVRARRPARKKSH
ncbi:MAG: TfoX/Sxy family protein [Hylemonella sp.]|uniref:TfoX/Sxy family protein n=1 Tax=Hylemonella sp. TaxID=2066020 RepID=UPI0022C5D789|nr:TfoX/Sxy family protein [Hylemonella sp.]MCZ8252791.1 TfoX/Sxy family protein [Hylemonella sp.]